MGVKASDFGQVVATDVDFETFLEHYMDQSAEWINGEVLIKTPVSGRHNKLVLLLAALFDTYLSKTGGSEVRSDRFTMRLKDFAPEPDVLVVLPEHLDRLRDTYLEDAADLAVEIVSKDSSAYDRGFKFDAYEANGVPEYWIIDPLRQEGLFYVLDAQGIYQQNPPNADGIYTSKILPHFRFPVRLLFQDTLPNVSAAVAMVNQMLD